MIKKTITFIVMLFTAFATAFSQNTVYYEFKISSDNPSDGVSGFLKCFNMNGDSRVESTLRMPELPKSFTKTTSLSKKENPNKIYMLLPASKLYSEVSFAEFNETGKVKEDYDINFLGNEVINGYNSTHIISKYSSGKLKSEVWISKGVPGFNHFVVSKANQFFNDPEFFKLISGKGIEGIPVRIKTIAFEKPVTFDLITAEKRDADDSFFEIPADYTIATPIKLSTAENVAEDMKKMTQEEAQQFLILMKKRYGLE